MIYCPACGQQLRDAAVSCPACGRAIQTAQPYVASDWFSLDGRIGRRAFWLWYVLPLTAGGLVAGGLDWVLGRHHVVDTIYTAAALWPSLAASVKRLHDRDRSGWYQLFYLIPVFGWFWMAVELGFLRGTHGPNRFGPDPVGPDPVKPDPLGPDPLAPPGAAAAG